MGWMTSVMRRLVQEKRGSRKATSNDNTKDEETDVGSRARGAKKTKHGTDDQSPNVHNDDEDVINKESDEETLLPPIIPPKNRKIVEEIVDEKSKAAFRREEDIEDSVNKCVIAIQTDAAVIEQFQNHEKIFMPVLHNGKWTLYVARTEEKLVVVFDTKHYSQESYHKTLLPSVLRYTVKVVLIITKSKSLQMESWKVMTFNNIPTEMKPQDSGMLCILFMMIILDDVDMWMHWYKDNEWIYKQQVCSLILTDEVNELHGSMWDLVNAEDP